jgi:outer membrane protein assembly factor BamB
LNRSSLFIVVGLFLVVVATLLVVLYGNGFLTDLTEPKTESMGILWQRDIENFATGLAAADGKVYTIDIWGNICCYEAQTGVSVWNGSIGAYWGKGVTASNSMVYGGKSPVRVGAVKASTGELQWTVGTLHDSAWSKRAPSNITVLENRLFVTGDSFAVYNATTGKLLWENVNNQFSTDANVTNPGWLTAWPFEGNRLFGAGGVIRVGYFVYRLDPDTGTVLWSRPSSTLVSGIPVVYESQVIMQNGTEDKTTVFSLNEKSGKIIWSYNVDAKVFQPTAYNGLLFFGASDNSFYALHLANGTVAWKSVVDSQNITALVNFDNPLEGLPIKIDAEHKIIVGGFAVTTQTVINETRVEDDYWGILCSLDIKTGKVNWTEHFTGDGDISNEYSVYAFALTENNVYLTTINDFWIFSKTTGNIIESQHFEHYISSPVAADNRVFVAADLWLIAYE